MPDTDRYISDRDTLERLVRLETKICLKFEELDKTCPVRHAIIDRDIVLARETLEKSRIEAKETIEHRMEGMNQFQKRIDRLEASFATKDDISYTKKIFDDKYDTLARLVYIGVGLVLAAQVALHVIK
jgi:hypothetical protein